MASWESRTVTMAAVLTARCREALQLRNSGQEGQILPLLTPALPFPAGTGGWAPVSSPS